MAQNVYEGMFILDANRYNREPDVISGQISEMIQGAGGEVLVSRLWEERRLAYTIRGHRKGAYWLTYFRLEPERLTEILRQCQLNDSILRTLFLKVDPRIVDALVAHAQAGSTGAAPAPSAPAAGAPAAESSDKAADGKAADGKAADGKSDAAPAEVASGEDKS